MCLTAFDFSAAGHGANGGVAICLEKGTDKWVLKPLDSWEHQLYENLETNFKQDPVRAFIPKFYGVHDKDVPFLRLDNLVHGMVAPHVMDIKLGKRTFLFSANENETPRSDLFQKLQKKSNLASALTSSELTAMAVTKRRYLELRDASTTTTSLGFRVEGAISRGSAREMPSAHQQPVTAMTEFMEGLDVSAWKIVEQLIALRDAMESSSFVRQHEFIGTSVLLIADAATGKCRVAWIDFAKARLSNFQEGLSHRAPCEEDSQEDGLLTGLDNLIKVWTDVAGKINYVEEATSQNVAGGLQRKSSTESLVPASTSVCSKGRELMHSASPSWLERTFLSSCYPLPRCSVLDRSSLELEDPKDM
jgi:1D-myo-inositol-triphosphate 3-kinase